MKAKELIKLLEQNPELEVKFAITTQETDEYQETIIGTTNIFVSEYEPEEIIFADKWLIRKLKDDEVDMIDQWTKPR